MRTHRLALALLLAPSTLLAAESLDRLPDLVEAGRMQAAYEFASEHVDDRAGEPRFDLYYGIAAINTGHVDEGIFALERVLLEQPGLDRARLELARGYFLQQEDRKAREQFEIVLSHDPPPAIVDRVQRYLAAIQRRSDRYEATVTGYAEIAGGYDDNVNRVSDDTTTLEPFPNIFPGATTDIGSDTDPEGDGFLRGAGAVDVSYPLRPGFNLLAGARGSVRGHQDETDFDQKRASARAGARYTTGPHRITAYLRGQRFYIGSDPYRGSAGISASYRYDVSDRTGLQGLLQVDRLRYDELEQRDSTLALVGGGVSHSWSAWLNPRGRFNLLLGQESADEDSKAARSQAERDLGRLQGALNVDPAPEWTLQTTLSVDISRYDSEGPAFGNANFPPEARDEETYRLELDLQWQPTANWQLGPFVSYGQRDSNIAVYEYDRVAGGVRLRYSFY